MAQIAIPTTAQAIVNVDNMLKLAIVRGDLEQCDSLLEQRFRLQQALRLEQMEWKP